MGADRNSRIPGIDALAQADSTITLSIKTLAKYSPAIKGRWKGGRNGCQVLYIRLHGQPGSMLTSPSTTFHSQQRRNMDQLAGHSDKAMERSQVEDVENEDSEKVIDGKVKVDLNHQDDLDAGPQKWTLQAALAVGFLGLTWIGE